MRLSMVLGWMLIGTSVVTLAQAPAAQAPAAPAKKPATTPARKAAAAPAQQPPTSELTTKGQYESWTPAQRLIYLAGVRDALGGLQHSVNLAKDPQQKQVLLLGLQHCRDLSLEEEWTLIGTIHKDILARVDPEDDIAMTGAMTVVDCVKRALAAGRIKESALDDLAAQPPAPAAAPAGPRTWKRVEWFAGKSDRSTPRFSIASREWRIKWRAKPEGHPTGHFSVNVVNASTGESVARFMTPESGGSDTYYVRAEPGEFYLEIRAVYSDYSVEVES